MDDGSDILILVLGVGFLFFAFGYSMAESTFEHDAIQEGHAHYSQTDKSFIWNSKEHKCTN